VVLGRRTPVLALVSVVALAAGCGGTGRDLAGDPTPAVNGPPSPSSTAAPSAPASSPSTPRPASPPTGPGTRALFFGDSYFVGGGYTGPDDSMAAVAAGRLGWDREIAGGGGTGFVEGNPDYGLKNFIGQIQDGALDVGPVDWLVVEGGGNDKLDDPALIQRQAVEVLTEAEREHPEARVVLVGTLDPTVDDFSDTDGVVGALAAAAAEVGVPYVNAQRWLEGRPELVGPDFDHPLPEGHQLLGGKLADALLALA
jgi:lysophospholipase L1-like esterase